MEHVYDLATGRRASVVRTRYPFLIPLYGLRDLVTDLAGGSMRLRDWGFLAVVLYIMLAF